MPGITGPRGLRRRARLGGAGIFCLALAFSSAACSSQSQAHELRGCYVGAYHLEVNPSTAGPDDLVTVTASGPWQGNNITTESYGLFGMDKGGRFVATYNLAAIAPGIQREQNVPIGPSGAVGGVGLPNEPFRVRVPTVPNGDYVVQFSYSVSPGASSSNGPRLYNLCASLHVKS